MKSTANISKRKKFITISRIDLRKVQVGKMKDITVAKKYNCSIATVKKRISLMVKSANEYNASAICANCKNKKCNNKQSDFIRQCIYNEFYQTQVKKGHKVGQLNVVMNDLNPLNLFDFVSPIMLNYYYAWAKKLPMRDRKIDHFLKTRWKFLKQTLFNPEWLYKKYVDEALSTRDIAKAVEVSQATASRYLHETKYCGTVIFEYREPFENQFEKEKYERQVLKR